MAYGRALIAGLATVVAGFVGVAVLSVTAAAQQPTKEVPSFAPLGMPPDGGRSLFPSSKIIVPDLPAPESVTGIEIRVAPPVVTPDENETGVSEDLQDAKPEAENWPAIQKIVAVVGRNLVACTATLVGPRVLLTAAHCIGESGKVALQFVDAVWIAPEKLIGECTRHPGYRPQGRQAFLDYALCLLDRPYPRRIVLCMRKLVTKLGQASCDPDTAIAAKIRFDNLSIKPGDAALRVRDKRSRWLLLTGFGCRTRDGKMPDSFELSMGIARITYRDRIMLVTGSERLGDSATVCQGDSGGPVYRLFTRKYDGSRSIVAVNSRNYVVGRRVLHRSLLARTSALEFVVFLRSWLRNNGNPFICGIDRDEKLTKELCQGKADGSEAQALPSAR